MGHQNYVVYWNSCCGAFTESSPVEPVLALLKWESLILTHWGCATFSTFRLATPQTTRENTHASLLLSSPSRGRFLSEYVAHAGVATTNRESSDFYVFFAQRDDFANRDRNGTKRPSLDITDPPERLSGFGHRLANTTTILRPPILVFTLWGLFKHRVTAL